MLALHQFPPSVVLQSGPTAEAPALGPPLAVWVVLCLVGLVLGFVGAALVRRLSNPVGKFRLLYLGVLAPFGLFAYGVLSVLDFGAAILTPLLGPRTGPLRVVLADFLTMLAASIVGLAVYAPTVPAVRAVRNVGLGTGEGLAKLARFLLGLSVLLAVSIAPIRLRVTDSPLLLSTGFVVVIAVVFLAASPWLVAVLRSTRRPTGVDADRLAALRDHAGLDIRDVRVLDTDAEETADVLVRGPPGYRRLFVTSTFLDAFDDDAATALLAVQAGRVRSRVLSRRFCALIGAVLPLMAALSGLGPRLPLLLAAVVVLVGGFWLSRRGIAAADDYAAERVSAGELVAAFERYAAFHGLEPSHRRVPNLFSANVPLGDRIDRLRDRAGGDASGDDGDDGTGGGHHDGTPTPSTD